MQFTNVRKNQSCFIDLLMEKQNININITRLKVNNEIYEDPKEITKVLDKNFKEEFTTEFDYKKPQGQVKKIEM